MNFRCTSALLFVLLYGIALIRPAMPIVDYYVKLDKYLEQCVNKQTSFCKGQCVLMQKLQMLDNRSHNEDAPLPVTINMQEYPIAIIDVSETTTASALSETIEHGFLRCGLPKYKSRDIFHPPV